VGHRHRRLTRSVSVMLLAMTVVASACGGDDDDGSEAAGAPAESATAAATGTETTSTDTATTGSEVSTLVGTVEGTDAFIGIQTVDGDTLVYICDGDKIWSYLDGEVAGDQLTATEPGGLSVTATVSDTGADGSVVLEDGSSHSISAALVTGEAGLFALATDNGDGEIALSSWIRLADGQVRGKDVAVTVTTAGAGGEPDATAAGVGDGGGGVAPGAEAVPTRVSLIRCAAALIRLAKAQGEIVNGTSTLTAEQKAAVSAAAAAACGSGGAAS
jgi:hypothetical protein